MMTRYMAGAVLLLSMNVAVAQYKTDGSYYGRDEQEVLKVDKLWAQALEKEDAAAIDKILAPEYTMVDSAGVTASRAEVLNQLRSGILKFDSFKASEQKVRIFQGGAVLTGKASTKGKFKDKDIGGDYRFIDVYEFKNGAWKAVYTQLSEIKPTK
jgi:hypothetical protein